jgi:exocyst complex protein 7
MERLPQVEAAAASALITLGDGNWKMGEGVQVGVTAKSGDNDERVILEHFVCSSLYILSVLRTPI